MTSSNSAKNSSSITDITENYVILKITLLYVQPLISSIGLTGNCLTFIILSKEGIRKPSNIIILSLTLADCLFLMRSVNAVHLMARLGHPNISFDFYGWETSIEIGYFVYIVDKVTSSLEQWGGYVATNIPVVITVERFIAVFFPLKFKAIMTGRKALLITITVWLFWLPWSCSSLFYYSVGFTTQLSGTMFAYLYFSQMFINGYEVISRLDDYFFNFLSSIVPISLVCVGCILIGFKVRITLMERKRLATVGRSNSLRTTRTLVSVSMIFAVLHLTYFIISVVFEDEFTQITTLGLILTEVKATLVLVCASCNFFVYVILNSKFRKTLWLMCSLRTFSQI